MKKIRYRKLIRDKIPSTLKAKGIAFEVRTLSRVEFRHELLKKVGEEASALPNVVERSEMTEELADILDVVDAVRKEFGITAKQLKTAQEANVKKKGGFRKRVYLEWSQDDGYRSNERKGNA